MPTVFGSGALAVFGFENASAKCGPSRLDSLIACSYVLTETRVGMKPEASSCENRGMSGYGMSAPECRPDIARSSAEVRLFDPTTDVAH